MRLVALLYWLLAVFLCCSLLTSCETAARRKSTVAMDGTKQADTQLYMRWGGKGGYASTADGFLTQSDLEKSFGQAMTALGTAVAVTSYASVEKARSAATATTQQTGIQAGAATERARIGATERTAKVLGNNPEANVPAINAAGNLFK